jgi:hypothetical protein
VFLSYSLLLPVWLTQRNCQLTNVVLRAAVRLPTVIKVCGRTSHEGYMAHRKLVTAEEPKHAIKASLRAGGTIGDRANQSDTLNQRVVRRKDTYLAGSIGRKWRDDFSTRRPVGGPKGHETCRARCYGLWAKEFGGSKALWPYGPPRFLPETVMRASRH